MSTCFARPGESEPELSVWPGSPRSSVRPRTRRRHWSGLSTSRTRRRLQARDPSAQLEAADHHSPGRSAPRRPSERSVEQGGGRSWIHPIRGDLDVVRVRSWAKDRDCTGALVRCAWLTTTTQASLVSDCWAAARSGAACAPPHRPGVFGRGAGGPWRRRSGGPPRARAPGLGSAQPSSLVWLAPWGEHRLSGLSGRAGGGDGRAGRAGAQVEPARRSRPVAAGPGIRGFGRLAVSGLLGDGAAKGAAGRQVRSVWR